jgi:hypothetical protein
MPILMIKKKKIRRTSQTKILKRMLRSLKTPMKTARKLKSPRRRRTKGKTKQKKTIDTTTLFKTNSQS